MVLQEVLNLILQADSCSDGSLCPATYFTAIGTAFATQGYWAQADLLYWLTETGMNQIAGLIYVLAGMAAIVSMALGQPPRNYLWLLVGPAVYHWLIATTEERQGGRWMVAFDEVTEDDMKEVWKHAHAGLANSSIARRWGLTARSFPRDMPPVETVEVALFFTWVDEFVSDITQFLVSWTGVYSQAGDGGANTNLSRAPGGIANERWHIMSDLKWGMLEDITAAKLKNGDLRDAFVTFLASECGDKFALNVNKERFIAAAAAAGKNVPETIFVHDNPANFDYAPLIKALRSQAIPIPPALKNLVNPPISGGDQLSFADSADYIKTDIKNFLDQSPGISCDAYLWILMHGFLWEAGHAYWHMVQDAPATLQAADAQATLVYNLFYGWDMKDGAGNQIPASGGTVNTIEYMKNLILLHLIRNELSIAPQPVDTRYSAAKESRNYVDSYMRTIQSKTKYGEVYSWALMMPYIQGVMFYVMAMAYPFAALMVIVPGWHKTIITWCTFWIWLKVWDVGFAIVKVLERSIWAMLGNNSNMAHINTKIIEMADWATTDLSCASGHVGTINCIPAVEYSGGHIAQGGMVEFDYTLRLLDRAMTLGANMDLDLANSYYIYIMAALYFAVPAVTGQIVLGAKAGASSLVGGMMDRYSDKANQAVASGATGDMSQRIQTNMGSVGNAASLKAMRTSPFATQAIEEGNKALDAGLKSSSASTRGAVAGQHAQQIANAAKASDYATGVDRSSIHAAADVLKQASSAMGAAGAAAARTPGGAAAAQAAAQMRNTGIEGVARAADVGAQLINLGTQQQALAEGSNLSMGQAQQSATGFGAGAEQSRANMHGNRLQAHAGYDSQMKAWEAKRNFGNQIAGQATIGGIFAGGISPGPKPEHLDGLAMAGMLNTFQQPAAGGGMSSAFNTGSGGIIKDNKNVRNAGHHAAPGGVFDMNSMNEQSDIWSAANSNRFTQAPVYGGLVGAVAAGKGKVADVSKQLNSNIAGPAPAPAAPIVPGGGPPGGGGVP